MSSSSIQGEKYFLRLLLTNVPGATSYDDLRTVEGVLYGSFQESAQRRGLLEDDQEVDKALTDATLAQMPSQIRSLFSIFLSYGSCQDPSAMWEKHKAAMMEDFVRR